MREKKEIMINPFHNLWQSKLNIHLESYPQEPFNSTSAISEYGIDSNNVGNL